MHEWFLALHRDNAAFPSVVVAIKMTVALGIGLLVGFEREWAHKDIGVRTFGLTALLGMLAAFLQPGLLLLAMAGILALIVIVNLRTALAARALETTTSVALIITFLLGVLVGNGHLFTSVMAAIVMTMLLSLKPQFRRFAGGLQAAELRSFVLLGLLGFVIWPLLPDRFIDRWQLIQPREAWIAVVVVACLGFINYVFLRLYGNKGVYVTAVLGGLVNSTAAGAELSTALPRVGLTQAVVPALMLTCIAMFLRNILLLLFFAPSSAKTATLPLLAMTVVSLVYIYAYRGRKAASPEKGSVALHLESPVSLKHVLSFGAILVAVQVLSSLGQRLLGSGGLWAVSFLGGLVSSASATVAAAALAQHGQISPVQAGIATVMASIASAVVDVPIVSKQAHDRAVTRQMIVATALRVGVGVAFALVPTVFPAWKIGA